MPSRALVLSLLCVAACGGGDTASDLSTTGDLSPPVPTYASFAQGFFASYCVSCHPSASSTRDFTQYGVIQLNSHDIACGVSPTALPGCSGTPAPGQFPIGTGPHPTDDARNQLVRWIQAGLPK
jgi:hypothetical protein